MPAGTAWHIGDVGYREAELAVPVAPGLTAGGSGLLQRQDPFVDCAGSVLQAGEDVLEDELGMVAARPRVSVLHLSSPRMVATGIRVPRTQGHAAHDPVVGHDTVHRSTVVASAVLSSGER